MPCAARASVQVVGEMGSPARQSDDSILKNTSFGWSSLGVLWKSRWRKETQSTNYTTLTPF